MRFTCKTCGEEHEGLPDLAFDAPYYFYTVPEAERGERCTLSSDLCSIDERDFFIRGCLEIPLIDAEGAFAWGVWMSVSERNFLRYQEVFEEPIQAHVGPFTGWLSSRLPDYPDTLTLKVRAHLRDHGERPLFELEPTDHPLAVAQREGITLAELQQIYEQNLHPADPGTGDGETTKH
jgi:hypothetical protein